MNGVSGSAFEACTAADGQGKESYKTVEQEDFRVEQGRSTVCAWY